MATFTSTSPEPGSATGFSTRRRDSPRQSLSALRQLHVGRDQNATDHQVIPHRGQHFDNPSLAELSAPFLKQLRRKLVSADKLAGDPHDDLLAQVERRQITARAYSFNGFGAHSSSCGGGDVSSPYKINVELTRGGQHRDLEVGL